MASLSPILGVFRESEIGEKNSDVLKPAEREKRPAPPVGNYTRLKEASSAIREGIRVRTAASSAIEGDIRRSWRNWQLKAP